MKITCDNCSAKYSIADEKVQGKVFKIRCKKCAHIIVVRGTSEQPAVVAAPARAAAETPAPGEDAVWYLVVDGEQAGPLSEGDVRDRFARNEIDGETFIWREGLADWIRLSTVPEFAGWVAASSAAVAAAPSPATSLAMDAPAWDAAPHHRPASSDHHAAAVSAAEPGVNDGLFAAGDDAAPQATPASTAPVGGAADVPDLFASVSGAASAQPPTAEAPRPRTGDLGTQDLFSGPVASGAASFSAGFGSGSGNGQPGSGMMAMTGQRGENSVLFSLANLQALAMQVRPQGQESADGKREAAASGSGMIDIRALSGGTGPVGASDGPGAIPGTLVVGPALMPVPVNERPAWVMPLVFVGGGIVVALVALVIVLVMRPATVTPPATPASADAPVALALADVPQAADPAAEKAEPVAAAGAEKKPAETAKETPPPARKAAAEPRVRKTAPVAQRETATRQETRPAPAPRRASPKQDQDELGDLIDGALGGKAQAPAARRQPQAATKPSGLPKQLSREDIQQGMGGVRHRVQSCYDRYKVPGIISLQMRVGPDGRVLDTKIQGTFNGTPTGDCVAEAGNRARFPQFDGPPMSFTYPFVLR